MKYPPLLKQQENTNLDRLLLKLYHCLHFVQVRASEQIFLFLNFLENVDFLQKIM